MLRDGTDRTELDGWMNPSTQSATRSTQSASKQATVPKQATAAKQATAPKQWQYVDEQLRGLAKQYVALDAELAGWLREAERVQVWRHVGCATMLEYVERVFGYSPRQGRDRLLVARRLGGLPELEAALKDGELPYTAVRELARVATPQTESAWVQQARGRCLRDIEALVSQRKLGDGPSDPPRPDSAPMRIAFDVAPETYALFRQVWKMLEGEYGEALSDDALFAAILDAVVAPADAEARKGRAKFQIAMTLCEWCKRTVQHGGGRQFAVDRETRERAQCDAQYIGSLDADHPARATQDVPPRVRRLVMQRDGYRCRAPGCRSARFLEVHHIVHQEDGGTHEMSNLILLCDAHHTLHHDGLITISGRAPDNVRFQRGSAWSGGGRRLPVEESWLHPRIEAEPVAINGETLTMPHVGHDEGAMTHVGHGEPATPHVGQHELAMTHVGHDEGAMTRVGHGEPATPHVGQHELAMTHDEEPVKGRKPSFEAAVSRAAAAKARRAVRKPNDS